MVNKHKGNPLRNGWKSGRRIYLSVVSHIDLSQDLVVTLMNEKNIKHFKLWIYMETADYTLSITEFRL